MRPVRARAVAAVTTVVIASMLAGANPSGAQANDGRIDAEARPEALVLTDISFDPALTATQLLGGDVRGVISVVVVNADFLPAHDVSATVFVGARTMQTPPIDLDPGETARVDLEASLGGMSFRERAITARLGQSEVATLHRSIPWLLVGLVVFALNVILLAGRDNLRASVVRRVQRDLSGRSHA